MKWCSPWTHGHISPSKGCTYMGPPVQIPDPSSPPPPLQASGYHVGLDHYLLEPWRLNFFLCMQVTGIFLCSSHVYTLKVIRFYWVAHIQRKLIPLVLLSPHRNFHGQPVWAVVAGPKRGQGGVHAAVLVSHAWKEPGGHVPFATNTPYSPAGVEKPSLRPVQLCTGREQLSLDSAGVHRVGEIVPPGFAAVHRGGEPFPTPLSQGKNGRGTPPPCAGVHRGVGIGAF